MERAGERASGRAGERASGRAGERRSERVTVIEFSLYHLTVNV